MSEMQRRRFLSLLGLGGLALAGQEIVAPVRRFWQVPRGFPSGSRIRVGSSSISFTGDALVYNLTQIEQGYVYAADYEALALANPGAQLSAPDGLSTRDTGSLFGIKAQALAFTRGNDARARELADAAARGQSADGPVFDPLLGDTDTTGAAR